MAFEIKRYRCMKWTLSFLLFVFINPLFGQKNPIDPLPPQDSVIAKKESQWPVPRKALLYAIIPGGGQLYNKKWWKVPIVYGAIGVGGYWLYKNQKAYRFYRDKLLKEINEPGSTDSNTTTLRNNRDTFDKSTQQAYLYVGIIYLLQAAEAFVDAHLTHFDVSDDLSWQLKPSTQQVYGLTTSALGIALVIPIGR